MTTRTSTRRRHRQLEPVRTVYAELLLQAVEPLPQQPQQLDIVSRLLVVLRILEIDVETVERVILDESDCRLDKARSPLGGRDRAGEAAVLRVGPASDREEDFEVPMGLLEAVERLEVAVQVRSAEFVPRVVAVVNLVSKSRVID